jgi:acyl-CoA thioesterase-2
MDIGAHCTVSKMSKGIGPFLELLDLESIEVNIFRGHHHDVARGRVFGGQVAAQALVAASRTVDLGRLHSLHAYFLRPGDSSIPILYDVDRIRDGGSFATRRVVAIQHGEAIFNLACSFHIEEEGLEHSAAMPEVPGPEDLPPSGGIADDWPPGSPFEFLDGHGLDIRFVAGRPWSRGSVPQEREQLWIRAREPIGDDPIVNTAIVTFVSDLTLMSTIYQRHGISASTSDHYTASLDHCMWFHHPLRADKWLLYDQQSPAAHGALGLTFGSLFDESGTLVASVAQQGLLRKRRGV